MGQVSFLNSFFFIFSPIDYSSYKVVYLQEFAYTINHQNNFCERKTASWRNFFDRTRSTSESNSSHFSYRKLLAPPQIFSKKKVSLAYKDDTQCSASDSG